MSNILSRKKVLIFSSVATSVMFIVVMFIVNPSIDGRNGMGVIALQVAFNKNVGIEIIKSWSPSGIEYFNRYIFTDYIYALSYSILFASILSALISKKEVQNITKYNSVIYLPFAAGLLDWIENTLELLFISKPDDFSNVLFFIHSFIATLKWMVLPVILVFIIKLIFEKKREIIKSQ